jgi:type I restriction enzyme R subunit
MRAKPYGNILDFRHQQDAVDTAIALFSGEKTGPQAREIWLVDKAPAVIDKFEVAVKKLDAFMKSQGLESVPEAVHQLKGDDARSAFINHFKDVQPSSKSCLRKICSASAELTWKPLSA